jgi:SAM-dependent methyltransferase
MELIQKLKKEFIFGFNSTRFNFLIKNFKDSSFSILDVGAGNHSAKKFKYLFPNSKYNEIDLDKTYNNDKEDFESMESFYEMDITVLQFELIPNNYFDVIIMSHIIEHLPNGDLVIEGLITKLKLNGHIYIEFPGFKSTKLPSMHGILNFYDDPTHVRIYSLDEPSHILLRNGIKFVLKVTRKNLLRIVPLPFLSFISTNSKKSFIGTVFLDLLGFAEYITGMKT